MAAWARKQTMTALEKEAHRDQHPDHAPGAARVQFAGTVSKLSPWPS